MSFLAVIPARFGSTRLPGKPLLEIAGQPMIQRVYARAASSQAQRVLVATDDQRIADVVRGFGGECVMTASDHPTGTDRLAEVADLLGLSADAIVVNVQGDEPLLPASAIHQRACLRRIRRPRLPPSVSRYRTSQRLMIQTRSRW